MKILYFTSKTKRKDPYQDGKTYDFQDLSQRIANGIREKFPEVNIVFPIDIATDEGYIPEDVIGDFDLYLTDMTVSNPSICYGSGVVEGLGKPIIYFTSSDTGLIPAARHKNHLLYSEASIEHEFINELNSLIEQAMNDPSNFRLGKTVEKKQPKAFISYSHKDREYLDRLLVHLRPLEKNGSIDVWQDTKIKTGDKWRDEIEKALEEANIAILLVSADFMASDFIVDNELPPLLSMAEVKGTKIVPVILSPCRFSRESSLNRFQAVNIPSEPLSTMKESEREIIYDKVAMDIESALKAT